MSVRKFFSGTLKITFYPKFNVSEVKSFMNFKCEQDQGYIANNLKNINN